VEVAAVMPNALTRSEELIVVGFAPSAAFEARTL
jgi:hypothetical protein